MFIHIRDKLPQARFDIIMIRLYPKKTIKHYMVVDRVILRLCHNKTLHEGRLIIVRLYPKKTIKHYMVFDIVILRLYHNKTLHEG